MVFYLFTYNNGCDIKYVQMAFQKKKKYVQMVIPGNVLVEHLTLRVQMGSNLLIMGNPLLSNDFHLTSAVLTIINSTTTR
jgi:hypothetical protein